MITEGFSYDGGIKVANRIAYLKSVTTKTTEDIEVYRNLSQKKYIGITDKEEIFRKAHFLHCFSQEIPVVIDAHELLVGSMRFWHAHFLPRNAGHIIVDYRMILQEGIPGIKNKIAKLSTQESNAFSEAVEAFCVFIQRYAQKAAEWNMKDVADNCYGLIQKAPETFYQALQLVWFVHLFLHAESMAPAVSFGRFDDYMYPFYKKDIENGLLTREQAKELLMCFWLKTCEGDESQNLTLGGNIENDLTFLCLEVASELKVQQPSISVRVSDTASDALWAKMIGFIKCKTGMPAIFNDNTVIKALQNVKVAKKDAENYAIVGCYEANSDGNTYGTTTITQLQLHNMLLAFLDSDKNYTDFSDFYCEFKNHLTRIFNTDVLVQLRKMWECVRNDFVSPFQSACMSGCLESGIPAEWGGCKYTMAGINILGIGTLADSLYAMKKIVFEEQKCTYRDFVKQVKNNFPDKLLAQKCKNLKGKYGTDNPETNHLARELSILIADLVDGCEIYEGVIPYAGLFAFLQDVYSHEYQATPDGRLKGERISYGIGASDFCADRTVTTVLNSAAHIANDRFADGNPLMFHISEKEAAGEKGDMLLKALIKGYFEKGGFHLQINITDAEILKQAKENPQAYSDLIIRISGYSEYFTRLNDVVQTALIERAENT